MTGPGDRDRGLRGDCLTVPTGRWGHHVHWGPPAASVPCCAWLVVTNQETPRIPLLLLPPASTSGPSTSTAWPQGLPLSWPRHPHLLTTPSHLPLLPVLARLLLTPCPLLEPSGRPGSLQARSLQLPLQQAAKNHHGIGPGTISTSFLLLILPSAPSTKPPKSFTHTPNHPGPPPQTRGHWGRIQQLSPPSHEASHAPQSTCPQRGPSWHSGSLPACRSRPALLSL